jgi:glycosyltransferase involved in cell wall biosynthesis
VNYKTIIVLPAYNAEKTLSKTIRAIPKGIANEIILVDDGSNDKTLRIAQKLGLTFYKHPSNQGYGANQKSCYKIALDHQADIVVMLHPDYQYDPHLIPHLVDFIKDNYFDIMLGSRIRTRQEALAGGMPVYKYYANRILTLLQNLATGQNLGEWHTGMRAYSRKVLKTIPFETFSNDFIFDTQMLLAAVKKNFRIGDIPVPVRYFPESSSINLSRSIRYGILTLWETFKYLLL